MILVVENDALLLRQLSEIVSVFKTEVRTAQTVRKALEILEGSTPQVVLLDRVLDDGDGCAVLEYIIDQEMPTRVLVLSQLSESAERVHGLEHGADDYLPKPFSQKELILRIKHLLNSRKESVTDEVVSDPFLLRPETGELFFDGKKPRIRRKELELLSCLMRYKNQVLSRDRLLQMVWSQSEELPTNSTLDVYIRRIRMVLGEHKCLLETVRGFGYRLNERKQN